MSKGDSNKDQHRSKAVPKTRRDIFVIDLGVVVDQAVSFCFVLAPIGGALVPRIVWAQIRGNTCSPNRLGTDWGNTCSPNRLGNDWGNICSPNRSGTEWGNTCPLNRLDTDWGNICSSNRSGTDWGNTCCVLCSGCVKMTSKI